MKHIREWRDSLFWSLLAVVIYVCVTIMWPYGMAYWTWHLYMVAPFPMSLVLGAWSCIGIALVLTLIRQFRT